MTATERRARIHRLRLLQRNTAAHPLNRDAARIAADSLERGLLDPGELWAAGLLLTLATALLTVVACAMAAPL